ncbi:expressed unknown protein [Seminavis robusta]|uniref:Uncharacterized protein n=1 Tax=Seminavis robusta TaxID=568900 RepID=A0A9N8H9R1_9STRA|nr:expressed unknown protein [Seminavis robusta]|eukprot:Sro264_g102610.1 n/a (215) ;mRNA; f:60926-61570
MKPLSSSSSTRRSRTQTVSIFTAAATNYSEEDVQDNDCPRGYFLNSVENSCTPLGPLGRISQYFETMGPFQRMYQGICNLFGLDTQRISNLGVTFALSYSILSQINASISLSMAWYLSCKRTGLSPLAPGQWKSLLTSYASLYAVLTVLRPFRVAAAVAMSKLSKEMLEATEQKLDCSRSAAIAFQYALGWIAWLCLASTGVAIASLVTGVPIL